MSPRASGILSVLVLSTSILAGCSTPNSGASVPGTMTYLERIALPPSAEISVLLQDISLADTPAKTLGEDKFTSDGKQVPFPFEVKYNSADIVDSHNYVVRGEIRLNGNLLFTTTQAYPVITRGNPTSGIELILSKVK
jgi:putative lipoprotein